MTGLSRKRCVAPETKIITRTYGEIEIQSKVGVELVIWNGYEWITTIVEKTGLNQPVVTVELSSKNSLDCTLYHKWFIKHGYGSREIETKDLRSGMIIDYFSYPDSKGKLITTMRVDDLLDSNRFCDTYSYTDPTRGRALYNGILTAA